MPKQNKIQIDYTKKYGRLTPIREKTYISSTGRKDRGVLCKCDCGKKKVIKLRWVYGGQTKSCGCYAKDCIKKRAQELITHGRTVDKTKPIDSTYLAWVAMKQACLNKTANKYVIRPTMTKHWKKFENFQKDMGDRPEGKRITLTRYDMTKQYNKENCLWMEYKDSQERRRSPMNKKRAKLAEETGLKYKLVKSRCARGWTPEEIKTSAQVNAKSRQSAKHPISKYKEEAEKLLIRDDQIKYYREKGCTLESIGKEYKLTRERIRQITNYK